LDTSPAHVLDLVDRKIHQFEMGTYATVACAVSSPPYETLTIALAGHLPPVVAVPGQPATFPNVETSPPIGAGATAARRSTTITLAPGTVAAFYTDGLIERRGESIDVGLERLRDVTSPGAPERVAADIMRHLVGNTITTDDIALVVMGRTPSNGAHICRSACAQSRPHRRAHGSMSHRQHQAGCPPTVKRGSGSSPRWRQRSSVSRSAPSRPLISASPTGSCLVCWSAMERRRPAPSRKGDALEAGASGYLDTRLVGREFVLAYPAAERSPTRRPKAAQTARRRRGDQSGGPPSAKRSPG
jgi:Stage II sporulation protein E (SpoIIE)